MRITVDQTLPDNKHIDKGPWGSVVLPLVINKKERRRKRNGEDKRKIIDIQIIIIFT